MNCMKCGREIEEGSVFCLDCLSDMANYPVKPGTVVLLPNRTAAAQPKKPARRPPSQEEQLRLLTRRNRRLLAALLLALLLAGASIVLALYGLQDEELPFLPGQNYSSQSTGSTDPT